METLAGEKQGKKKCVAKKALSLQKRVAKKSRNKKERVATEKQGKKKRVAKECEEKQGIAGTDEKQGKQKGTVTTNR